MQFVGVVSNAHVYGKLSVPVFEPLNAVWMEEALPLSKYLCKQANKCTHRKFIRINAFWCQCQRTPHSLCSSLALNIQRKWCTFTTASPLSRDYKTLVELTWCLIDRHPIPHSSSNLLNKYTAAISTLAMNSQAMHVLITLKWNKKNSFVFCFSIFLWFHVVLCKHLSALKFYEMNIWFLLNISINSCPDLTKTPEKLT